ncbi:hypothetical protein [Stenotrophomonas sp.]|uniref:hypothetical protein n=1 Tax=Stenotrophomonas sp. TaxID=69392 RepID=UPI0028AD5938|nr:hypothetical protein [Stenotrophomonas sp.]
MATTNFRIDGRSLLWSFCLVLVLVSMAVHQLRYSMYLIPFAALLAVVSTLRIKIPTPTLPFLAYAIAGAITVPLGGELGFKDCYFVFSGIALSLAFTNPIRFSWIKYLLPVAFIASIVGAITLRGWHGLEFDLLDSSSSIESTGSFVCGLFAVVALARSRWILFLIATLASLLLLKRAALLGIAVCIPFALLPDRKAKQLLSSPVMVLVNLVAVAFAVKYAIGDLDSVITALTGKSANEIGLGRQLLQSEAANSIVGNAHYILYGNGVGTAYATFLGKFGQGDANMHSDALKMIYELGLVFFLTFIWLGYRAKTLEAKMLFLYSNLIFYFDNTIIYSFYLFFLLSMQMLDQADRELKQGSHAPCSQ